MRVVEIQAKSLIQKSKIPLIDYVVNPYNGCTLSCSYCYASFSGKLLVNEPIAEWGNYVYVKANAVELVKKELAKMSAHKRKGSIFFSSATDAYQGVEKKYQITRGILQELANVNYQGVIKILTKSPLVLRDIDLLLSLPQAEVGMSIATTSEDIRAWLEPKVPQASSRFKTLKALNDAGVSTFAFVAPLLPHYIKSPHLLDELFEQIALCGVKEIYVDNINLKPYILERMNVALKDQSPEVKNDYRQASSKQSQEKLNEMVRHLLKKYKLSLKIDTALESPTPKAPVPNPFKQGDLFS